MQRVNGRRTCLHPSTARRYLSSKPRERFANAAIACDVESAGVWGMLEFMRASFPPTLGARCEASDGTRQSQMTRPPMRQVAAILPRIGVEENQAGSRPKVSTQPQRSKQARARRSPTAFTLPRTEGAEKKAHASTDEPLTWAFQLDPILLFTRSALPVLRNVQSG